ncbi:MAG: hypothetical protein GY805_26670 [Chloroflexi bacterium]|nr:hypothetical protein [Chloroflexota bacterium]
MATINSILRSAAAAQRRAERESMRQHRELLRQQKEFEKMAERAKAEFEVELYENQIDLLLSVHKDCGITWNWNTIKTHNKPSKPKMQSANAEAAQDELDSFKPSLKDKLLRRTEKIKSELVQSLEVAESKDREINNRNRLEYERELDDWKKLCELSDGIVNGELKAYKEAVKQINPFLEISALGSGVTFDFLDNSNAKITVDVNGPDVVPTEIKSVLKSGKLSTKKMPKGKFYEIHQDYVCGCSLRVARELFAILPIDMVIVNALGDLLNSSTGHMENQVILSVAIPRKTLERLNFDALDPSDSMENFVHRVKFQRLKGFQQVEAINPDELN